MPQFLVTGLRNPQGQNRGIDLLLSDVPWVRSTCTTWSRRRGWACNIQRWRTPLSCRQKTGIRACRTEIRALTERRGFSSSARIRAWSWWRTTLNRRLLLKVKSLLLSTTLLWRRVLPMLLCICQRFFLLRKSLSSPGAWYFPRSCHDEFSRGSWQKECEWEMKQCQRKLRVWSFWLDCHFCDAKYCGLWFCGL